MIDSGFHWFNLNYINILQSPGYRIEPLFKQLFVCAALVTMLMVNLVNAQESPPTSEKAKQIEALANKAAGTNTTGQKDANGKLFHHEFIQMAESNGSGWIDYMFPKPGQTQPSRKWAYVKAVTVDGVPSLVASGFYPE